MKIDPSLFPPSLSRLILAKYWPYLGHAGVLEEAEDCGLRLRAQELIRTVRIRQ